MKNTALELEEVISRYVKAFETMADSEFSSKPLPNKWSKKEVLGHLIDSAQNNLRRFIVGQYEITPSKIIYEQDFWVMAGGYQNAKKEDVILLWKLINLHIARVLSEMPVSNYARESDTGRQSANLHSLVVVLRSKPF